MRRVLSAWAWVEVEVVNQTPRARRSFGAPGPSLGLAAALLLAVYAGAQIGAREAPRGTGGGDPASEGAAAATASPRGAPNDAAAPSREPHGRVSTAPGELPRVVLEERMPRGWFEVDADRFPLRPARWRRRMPRRCRTQGGYIDHCQGDRRIAEGSEEEQARAERLGLGRRQTARWLMHRRPFDEWLDVVADLDDAPRLTFPVPDGRLGRGFGRVRRGSLRSRIHKGVDIGAPEGSTIVAARGGLVVYSDNRITGYGNAVLVLHREGYSTFYAHCQETLVAAGAFVERGQAIARVGQTGFAWAPHLHFEWRQRGWARDPARHFRPHTPPPRRQRRQNSPAE
ncbi:MAG: M23 family metallopeptidase [Myxococcota bacterium]